jgi:dynein heavy chain
VLKTWDAYKELK